MSIGCSKAYRSTISIKLTAIIGSPPVIPNPSVLPVYLICSRTKSRLLMLILYCESLVLIDPE